MNSQTEIPNTTSTEIALDEASSKINKLYAQAEALSKSAKEYAQKAIGIAFECGKILIETKKLLGHGKWITWARSNLNFSEDTAQRYMSLFRKVDSQKEIDSADETSKTAYVRFLEKANANTLRKAYIATGILPETTKLASSTNDESTVSYIRHIDFIVSWYRELTDEKDIAEWSYAEKQALLNDLKPIVEIYQTLASAEKNI